MFESVNQSETNKASGIEATLANLLDQEPGKKRNIEVARALNVNPHFFADFVRTLNDEDYALEVSKSPDSSSSENFYNTCKILTAIAALESNLTKEPISKKIH